MYFQQPRDNSLYQDQQPTFESNISALLSLKQQMRQLYHQYSPNSTPNIYHQEQVSRLKKQVHQARDRVLKFRSMIDGMEEGVSSQIEEVQREKDQLLDINQNIVKQSEHLAEKLNSVQEQKSEVERKYEQLLKERQVQKKRQKKEIQNLKLMHAQQLYMMKKKIANNTQKQ